MGNWNNALSYGHSSGVDNQSKIAGERGIRVGLTGDRSLRSDWRRLMLLAGWTLVVPLALAVVGRGADPAPSGTSAPMADRPMAPFRPAAATPGAATPSPASGSPATGSPAPTAGSTHEPAAGEATEVKPEVYYVRDKDGHLVPAPNFSYDDFVKYYRLKEQLERPEAKPHYNLQQATVQGAANGERAELAVELKVLTTDADWVRVPLRLGRCALREPAVYKGSGEEFLQYDANGDGYVCWLRGAAGAEHDLTLKLVTPLTATAGETRLDLSLPRAAASRVVLHVPKANVAAEATVAGATVAVEATAPKSGGSDLEVLGAGGEFSLVWRDADQPAAKISSALEVTGLMFVKIDGRSINTDAMLSVRSFGAEFDHFQVRLPPGAQLVGGRQPGCTVTALGADAGLAEVKLDRKTVGPIDVRLLTERAYDVTKANETLQLAGFAVAEAIPHRQWGHIAVAVSGDWQLVWGDRTRVQQVDELPESLRRKGLVAGFEYFGQPSALNVRVTQRKTRVGVEPQYVYRLSRDRLDLDARLHYSIRGARLYKLEIDLGDWEIDHVRPDNLVDLNSLAVADGGVVSLPLLQPASGDLDLSLHAHRRTPPAGKIVEWTLPEPRVDVLGPADVTIAPADDVELDPISDKLTGLSRAASGPSVEGAASQNPPLYFRAEQPHARFVANFAVHPQTIAVDVESQITAHLREIAVDQSLTYDIRYEPLERLTLDVPRELFDSRKMKFVVAGETVEPSASPEQSSADRRSVELALKRPWIGPLKLEVHFSLPQEKLTAAASRTVDLPLAMPADGQISSNIAILTVDPGIRLEQREGLWSVVESAAETSASHSTTRLAADGAATEIRAALSLNDGPAATVTFVDRAWIQSWLAQSVRQDRAVYSLTTSEDQLRLALPTGVTAADVEVLLDGKPAQPEDAPVGVLVLSLPAESGRREHLLELRYQIDGRSSHNGWLTFDAPRFENQAQIRRTYWQLVLPADEHLVLAPSGLTAEYEWTWREFGLGFDRVPLKEQRQLEQWVGLGRFGRAADATAGAAAPSLDLPANTSRYLFSTVGPESHFAVFIARRWLILFAASLISLSAGLAVVYLPVLRQPRTLVAAASALLAAAVIWPEPVVLLAQAAAFGVGLVMLALVLRRFVGRRLLPAPPPALSTGSAAIVVERSSQRFVSRPADTPTTTASIAIELSSHESTG
jgi:hypothetical protein